MADAADACLSPELMTAAARIDVIDALRRLPVSPEIRLLAFDAWSRRVGTSADLWEQQLIERGVTWGNRAAC